MHTYMGRDHCVYSVLFKLLYLYMSEVSEGARVVCGMGVTGVGGVNVGVVSGGSED